MANDSVAPSLSVRIAKQLNSEDTTAALLTVEASWSDAGGVDLDRVEVHAANGFGTNAAVEENLLKFWNVIRIDTAGMILRENVENLLHGGANELTVKIVDKKGNATTQRLQIEVPFAQKFRTIDTGVTSWWVNRMEICSDDHRLYATAGTKIVVIDADSMKLIRVMTQSTPSEYADVKCILDGGELLVTGQLQRFDRKTGAPLPEVSNSFISAGIVQSTIDNNIFYIGEGGGSIGIVDHKQNRRVGTLYPFTPGHTEGSYDLAMLPGGAKLYATRLVETGIMVLDPRTGVRKNLIRIGGDNWPDNGVADDIELSRDSAYLYAAVIDGNPRGVVRINTSTDKVDQVLALPNAVPQAFGMSPSGRRMWVSTRDQWEGLLSQNFLVDVQSMSVIQRFDRPRAVGETRYDASPAFHPSGKWFFVGHNLTIDVYLNRE